MVLQKVTKALLSYHAAVQISVEDTPTLVDFGVIHGHGVMKGDVTFCRGEACAVADDGRYLSTADGAEACNEPSSL